VSPPPESTALGAVLDKFGRLTIAVSGGVDSMTLATFAHRRSPGAIEIVHAVSPAVPTAATRRVQTLAAAENWKLNVTGAGEFEDRRYRDNPVDRCYFCKTNLYVRIRSLSRHRIASGANLDDLGDYRPGLIAADENRVVHPFVEAGMTKMAVRRLARHLGLGEIAELPAQPCLASRVETGIAIDAADLAFIERIETRLAAIAPRGATLRCRITHAGVAVEIGDEASPMRDAIAGVVRDICAAEQRRFAGVRPYLRGGMFVQSSLKTG
jgi:pyridinium-3,5-biscarboxylic acid mononucleotide sulfurtransferase